MNETQGSRASRPFGYCLNTSTIRRPGITALDALDIAAEAGYDGIEPWIRELDAYVSSGGSLDEYRKKAEDLGLEIVNVIAFIEWAADDEETGESRRREARRNLEICSRIGCGYLAAPPCGVTDIKDLDLYRVAGKYRELLLLGAEYGIKPILEFWWMSRKLRRLSEAILVAMESGHPDASVLVDIFHMSRGGSTWEGIRLLSGKSVGMVHINDYPAGPPKEELTDADRVFPGDGDAPLNQVLSGLHEIGYEGSLSLELFNKEHMAMDASAVARRGLEKMKSSVQAAIHGDGR